MSLGRVLPGLLDRLRAEIGAPPDASAWALWPLAKILIAAYSAGREDGRREGRVEALKGVIRRHYAGEVQS